MKRFALNVAICAMCLLSLSSSLLAQDDTSEFKYDSDVKRIAKPFVDSKVIDGASIGIIYGGKSYFYAVGNKRLGDGAEGQDAIYEIGSISKVFTGVLLGDAVASGNLKLDQNLGSLIDGLEKKSPDIAKVTLQHLTHHVSGLPRLPGNLSPKDPKNPYADYTRDNLVTYLKETVLLHPPGEHRQYSNLAAGLLGDLIAKQWDKSYEEVLLMRIAGPLGMDDTSIVVPKSKMSRFSKPYLSTGGESTMWDFDALAGAGGIRSTTKDMVKFMKANLQPPKNEIGKALNVAWEKRLEAEGPHRAMGLGWMIAGDGSTRWHNGQTGGYHSMMLVSRPLKMGVVVLSNSATPQVDVLAQDVFRALAGQTVKTRSFAK